MVAKYVEIPSAELFAFLETAGFSPLADEPREVVYGRRHERDRMLEVRVYTSVRIGAAEARGCGQDAIRVCLVRHYPNGSTKGAGRFPRIHRTGSVERTLERLHNRMRDAYALGNQFVKEGRFRKLPHATLVRLARERGLEGLDAGSTYELAQALVAAKVSFPNGG